MPLHVPAVKNSKRPSVSTLKDVFIVHGRDFKPIKELKEMLIEFGLNPIVLHEQPSGSRTIPEKLEKYSDVGFAFVILTPDDVGCLETEITSFKSRLTGPLLRRPVLVTYPEVTQLFDSLKPRARQNVVLEFGYFMGKLGRDRVCCLYKGDVELPSDMHGIVYIPFKESVKERRSQIVKELKEAGYQINQNSRA